MVLTGLTKAGIGRLNRFVEAFVYCIVGAEVNVRSSIVGDSGGGQETQQEMLKLFEDAVIAKSVQPYHLTIQEPKMRLNFAIAPGIWLMPANLVINTESVIGYNNYLLKAETGMTFGVNELINENTKEVGIAHNLGVSKVQLLHKDKPKVQPVVGSTLEKPKVEVETIAMPKPIARTPHDLNLATVSILAAGVGWYLFR